MDVTPRADFTDSRWPRTGESGAMDDKRDGHPIDILRHQRSPIHCIERAISKACEEMGSIILQYMNERTRKNLRCTRDDSAASMIHAGEELGCG